MLNKYTVAFISAWYLESSGSNNLVNGILCYSSTETTCLSPSDFLESELPWIWKVSGEVPPLHLSLSNSFSKHRPGPASELPVGLVQHADSQVPPRLTVWFYWEWDPMSAFNRGSQAEICCLDKSIFIFSMWPTSSKRSFPQAGPGWACPPSTCERACVLVPFSHRWASVIPVPWGRREPLAGRAGVSFATWLLPLEAHSRQLVELSKSVAGSTGLGLIQVQILDLAQPPVWVLFFQVYFCWEIIKVTFFWVSLMCTACLFATLYITIWLSLWYELTPLLPHVIIISFLWWEQSDLVS